MAGEIVSVTTGVLDPLLGKLRKLLGDETKMPKGAKKQLWFLRDELSAIKALLDRMELMDKLDPMAKDWRDHVRQMSYAMENCIDDFVHDIEGADPNTSFVKKMAQRLRRLRRRNQIAKRIEELKIFAVEANARRERYKVDSCPAIVVVDPRMKAIYMEAACLVGIEGPREEIVRWLTDSHKKRKVLSIVGFGGLGKTTLAKQVYDQIGGQFDCTAFVTVGQRPDFLSILRGLQLELGMKDSSHTCELQDIIERLRDHLQHKRFLLVMDDLWDERHCELFNYVPFRENNFGSRIIITTRIVSISKACCLSADDSVYQMESLSVDDSTRLFYKRIFSHGGECPDELEQVSSDILKKCDGVPLAIITVAYLLTSGQQIKPIDQWHFLFKSIGRALIEDDRWKEMQIIASLSYYHLPLYLRTFLLYLSIFPGGQTIDRDRLVKKWIMEGIITKETNLIESLCNMEEAASQYLHVLINRNVIQPLEYGNNGEVITCYIDLMMQDALKAIAAEEKFAGSFDDENIISEHPMNFRYISIDHQDSENPIELSRMVRDDGVRSLTVFSHANRCLLRNFKRIQVLDLEGCKGIERIDMEYICSMVLLKQLCLAKTQITELPPQIGNLQHLEGIDIGGTQIIELPREISRLKKLKTLDARKSGVMELPDEVVQLTGLVRLLIGDTESSEGVKLPDGIGKMTSLQQLCTIDLRKCSVSSVKELPELPCLQEIAVVASDDLEDEEMNYVLLSSLENSTNLSSLVFYGELTFKTRKWPSLYKCLRCPKKLTLVGKFLKSPLDISTQFLCTLDIRVCKIEEDDLERLRELPRLRSLSVRLEVLPRTPVRISREGFAELESFCVDCRMPRVIFEEGAMPKLGHLELKLYAGSASKEQMDIRHLLNLQEVRLRYMKWYGANKGVKETTDAVKTEAKEHQNRITLCIAEEDRDGSFTMTTEIFPENKDAGCSRITETEDGDVHADGTGYFLNGDDTQEGDLQSSCAIASSSGTNEIEEVVE